MSDLLYKAVALDYTSRYGLRWDVGSTVTHPTSTGMVRNEPETYLSLAAHPAQTLSGPRWPCRLLRVEPIGEVIDADQYRHKRCVLSARVVDEVEGWWAFGPNGEHVAALIQTARWLTCEYAEMLIPVWDIVRYRQTHAWDAAWVASGIAAWLADRDVGWEAASGATRSMVENVARVAARAGARLAGVTGAGARNLGAYATWDSLGLSVAQDVAGVAARALVVRDLIGTCNGWDQGAYDLLTTPWRHIVGRAHPEDP